MIQEKNIQIDVILFCETHLSDIQDAPIIGQYNSEHYIRPTNGGGISIYTLPQYKYTINTKLQKIVTTPNESLFLEIENNPIGKSKKPILVGEMYRKPGDPPRIFLQQIEKLSKEIRNKYSHVYLGTDDNIDISILEYPKAAELLSILHENYL